MEELFAHEDIQFDSDGEPILSDLQKQVFMDPATPGSPYNVDILDQPDPPAREDEDQQAQAAAQHVQHAVASIAKVPKQCTISHANNTLVITEFQDLKFSGKQVDFVLPPTDIAPPNPPTHYGSRIFPRLQLVDWVCPALQLGRISANFRIKEISMYNAIKIRDNRFSEFYNTRWNGKPFCRPCSEWELDPRPIYHYHASSHLDRLASEPDFFQQYNCLQCADSPHYFLSGGRLPVILTSSTLNNYHGDSKLGYRGDNMHADLLGIPGGRIKDITRAYRAEYGNYPLAVDALAVAGLNDILKADLHGRPGYSPERLQKEVRDALATMVDDANDLCRAVLAAAPPFQANSVSFAKLPTPPCLLWADTTGSYQGMCENIVKGQRIQLLKSFNDHVCYINTEARNRSGVETDRAPSFQAWGIKRVAPDTNMSIPRPDQNPSDYLQSNSFGPFTHRFAEFREEKIEKMLHFNDYLRLKMGRACIKYFRILYGLDTSYGNNKAEGTAILKKLKSEHIHQKRLRSSISKLRRDRNIFVNPAQDRCRRRDLAPV